VTSLSLAGVFGAAWAGPDDQLSDVKVRLDEAEQELSLSTKELAEATTAYRKATAKLPAAEEQLRVARQHLDAAKEALGVAEEAVEAAQRQALLAKKRLAEAEQKVTDQLAKVYVASAEIDDKRVSISHIATRVYQRGSGAELAMIMSALQAETMSKIAFAMQAKRSVIESEGAVLSTMLGDRAALANERVVLEDLRNEAEQRKAEAQEKLEATKEREAEARAAEAAAGDAAAAAEAAKKELDDLVQAREGAVQDAEHAKRADAAEYEKWKAERQSIQAEIDRIERERREKERAAKSDSGDKATGGGAPRNSDSSSKSSRSGGSSNGVSYPVASPYITSPYGMRVHPVTGVYKLHDGTDFRAFCGTPIRASVAGRVEWARYRGGYGNQVAVSGGRFVTTYSHLSRFAVSPGARVSSGQVIGYSGTTGSSTACHLHFMLYVDGVLKDPMSHL
jgi:murein DD-endopeptidase MepM/ murein hydrolase activator NlpD